MLKSLKTDIEPNIEPDIEPNIEPKKKEVIMKKNNMETLKDAFDKDSLDHFIHVLNIYSHLPIDQTIRPQTSIDKKFIKHVNTIIQDLKRHLTTIEAHRDSIIFRHSDPDSLFEPKKKEKIKNL